MKQDIIVIKCDWCKNEKEIKYSTYMTRKRKGKPCLCKDCMSKERSETLRLRMNNMNEDDKKKMYKKAGDTHKKTLSNLPEEEKKKRNNRLQLDNKRYRDNITPEEKARVSKLHSEANKRRFKNMTKEEYEIYRQHCREGYENRSEESKLQHKQNSIDMWKNKTIEEYEETTSKMSKRKKDWWDNLSKEEYIKLCNNIQKGTLKNLNNMSNKEIYEWINKKSSSEKYTSTEKEFINILNLNNIEFIPQYTNETIYPDFHKLFPNNPVTESDYTSPYHAWDFKISTLQKDILVDIDGSIHDESKFNNINPKGNQVFDHNKGILFNDSQRPYQTDNLDAYIIKAYNDIINDNTIVYSIKDNKDILFKDFILYLNGLNMNDKEIKEMIKLNK